MKLPIALLAVYDVLTNKITFHARGPQGVVVKHEVRLKSDIYKKIVKASSVEDWSVARIATELGVLENTDGKDLARLHAKYLEPREVPVNFQTYHPE